MKNFKGKSRFFLKLLILGGILFPLISFLEKKEYSVFNNFPLASQKSLFVDPIKKNKGEIPGFRVSQRTFLSPNSPPFIILPKVYAQIINGELLDNEILTHQVKEGETIWSVAKHYNLKAETIIWANNLESETIKPGQQLIIPPVDGAIHIVAQGETLKEIAQKYEADLENILVFNELTSPEEIFSGQVLIIPGAKLPKIPQTKSEKSFKLSSSNSYPYGYCTWWVAQKRAIPSWWGNAKDWLKNAQNSGYPVCLGSDCQPKVGAVVSLRTRHSLGHVAYVEEINGSKIIFSEMNYAGFGVVTKRVLKIGDPRIIGYIY